MISAMPGTLPRDARTPRLPFALDFDGMRSCFNNILSAQSGFARPVTVSALRVMQIKYRPERNCTLVYEVCVDDMTLNFTARLVPTGEGPKRLQRARLKVRHAPEVGAAVFLIQPLDMVVWTFPNDPKLDRLWSVLNIDRLRDEILPAVLAERNPKRAAITVLDAQVIRYNAKHCCTVRLAVKL